MNFFIQQKIKRKTLKNFEAEIIEYIAQENVQRAILGFNEFNQLNETTVTELKKYLALKEYGRAFTHLIGMLNDLNSISEKKAQESQTKKLIAEYELSMKFKL